MKASRITGHPADKTISGKTISVIVPCFNSAAYMDHCIGSLVNGWDDVEVLVIDDGSTDETPAKADKWQAEHPNIVRAIHQPNKGHGGAVMAGLAAARGEFVYVVDSDDWLDDDAFSVTLSRLRELIKQKQTIDLFIVNYVYEHVLTGTRKVIDYRGSMPRNKVFTWHNTGVFAVGHYITMHSAIYRTQMLRDIGLTLPEHTFYVDNIFVYVPLPHTKRLYYLPVDLYRYFIGRDDQSVDEESMKKRLGEQVLVTEIMASKVKLPDDSIDHKLVSYLEHYLGITVTISSIFAALANTHEALAHRQHMWDHIRTVNPELATRLMRQTLVWGSNLPTRAGRLVGIAGYRMAQRLYRFN